MATVDYTFRRARSVLADAAAVRAVERRSLGDSSYTSHEMLQVLQRPEHHAYLACEGKRAVGFLSCLETATEAGPRLELDLLGVLPEHRGRGLATTLLRLAIHEAQGRGTHHFRGAVAEDNVPSQAAFARAGLVAGAPAPLLVYEILGREPVDLPPGWSCRVQERPAPFPVAGRSPEAYAVTDAGGELAAQAVCQPVQTLSYRGLWIEELWADSRALAVALRAIVERAKALDLDQAGRLARGLQGDGELDIWLRQGYRNLGPYFVFTMG